MKLTPGTVVRVNGILLGPFEVISHNEGMVRFKVKDSTKKAKEPIEINRIYHIPVPELSLTLKKPVKDIINETVAPEGTYCVVVEVKFDKDGDADKALLRIRGAAAHAEYMWVNYADIE